MTARDIDRAYSALMTIPANCTRGDWHRIGCSGIAAGLSVDDIDAWSATTPDVYPGTKVVRAAFKNITPDGKVSEKTLFWFARQNGWSDTDTSTTKRTKTHHVKRLGQGGTAPKTYQAPLRLIWRTGIA